VLKNLFGGMLLTLAMTATHAEGPVPPLERASAAAAGTLRNPYNDTQADIVEQGKKLWFSKSCNGCHGGGGGGGMCPPVSNETWVYGGDDDTLFRLISGGSDPMLKGGHPRKGRENVVGPMPPFGALIATDDDLWKIITFIRSNYRGGPAKKYGDQAPPAAAAAPAAPTTP
jgi:mono/diheme cytochrome c family protein